MPPCSLLTISRYSLRVTQASMQPGHSLQALTQSHPGLSADSSQSPDPHSESPRPLLLTVSRHSLRVTQAFCNILTASRHSLRVTHGSMQTAHSLQTLTQSHTCLPASCSQSLGTHSDLIHSPLQTSGPLQTSVPSRPPLCRLPTLSRYSLRFTQASLQPAHNLQVLTQSHPGLSATS
jgi:hypothetical protein